MPQPFEQREGQKIHDRPRILETRPNCAIKIAVVAAEWTRVEEVMADMFATVTGSVHMTTADTASHSNNVAALFALRAIQSLTTRISVVKAATEVRFTADQREEFETLIRVLRDRAGERNDIVHGHWCTVDSYPNDVLLKRNGARKTEYTRYTEKDFDAVIVRIIALAQAMSRFGWDNMWKRMMEVVTPPPILPPPTPPPPVG